MIHHLARAFFIRSTASQGDAGKPPADTPRPASEPVSRPVKARPITPWGSTPTRQPGHGASSATILPLRAVARGTAGVTLAEARGLRICSDPSDARRTVIAGRFAEVCAALDRLVMEQEALA